MSQRRRFFSPVDHVTPNHESFLLLVAGRKGNLFGSCHIVDLPIVDEQHDPNPRGVCRLEKHAGSDDCCVRPYYRENT